MKIAKGRGRWASEHEGKMVHGTEADANRYLVSTAHGVTSVCGIYQCRWGDSYEYGENEPLHWHVGRKRKQGF